MVKETDLIFLKTDSTIVRQLKGLVKGDRRRPSVSGKATKEILGVNMLKNLHKQGSNRVRKQVLNNRTVLKHDLSCLMSGEESKNPNPFTPNKGRERFAQLVIKKDGNVKECSEV